MHERKIQPEYLKPGDNVAIISPSYWIDEIKIDEAVSYLESWGLRVHVGENALKRRGPFAGTDDERLSDFQKFTSDPGIKAVICSRGGYGMAKIISKVDFSVLRQYPKWYVGFSDITVLHLWLSEVCGIVSVHGEMALNYNNPEKSAETFITLKQSLFGGLLPCSWEGTFIRPGYASGEITGGNLSLIYSMLGSEASPETDGRILFIEEVGEYYYHLDRMMTSLKLAGKLDGLAAIIVGGMTRIEEVNVSWGKTIEETIFEAVKEYDYPLLFNYPAGHIPDNRAFYMGKEAQIEVNGKESTLSFL